METFVAKEQPSAAKGCGALIGLIITALVIWQVVSYFNAVKPLPTVACTAQQIAAVNSPCDSNGDFVP
jgi:hypothetical protein